MNEVRRAYKNNGGDVYLYESEKLAYLEFKKLQQAVKWNEATFAPYHNVEARQVPAILTLALYDLLIVMDNILMFLNSPTEELIIRSYDKWAACYKDLHMQTCHASYRKWKIQYNDRTLHKHLKERMEKELSKFKGNLRDEDEFDLVFDTEHNQIDVDGFARFLFTNPNRFGVSLIDPTPLFSMELCNLFDFMETWKLMQADMQPQKKPSAKAPAADELEQKVMALTGKVKHLVADKWSDRIDDLWMGIIKYFRKEIGKAGTREIFKDYSKKTVYCIIGHLKSKGVYRKNVTNSTFAQLLEDGQQNGLRKYVNNGLSELNGALKERIEVYLDQALNSD